MTKKEAEPPTKLDAIRFCVGPWDDRFSSMWRVWRSPTSDDLYLGVTCLLQKLKISLHRSGKFRAAFVEDYHDELVSKGKDPDSNRAFMKWDKPAVVDHEILEALDLHFPLSSLCVVGLPNIKPNKLFHQIEPHEESLKENDTLTIKVLFHRTNPESISIKRAFRQRSILNLFSVELNSGEYVSFAACYTKQLPIELNRINRNVWANNMLSYFKSSGYPIGSKLEIISTLVFQGATPPRVYSVGGLSFEYVSETEVSLSRPT